MGVGRQFGDIVRFACQQGHRLFGEQELVCGPQGAWSNNPPACHRVWCDPPVLGSGVGLPQTQSQGSHPHRSILMLECREGHRARGDLRITCQANGRWSRPEGACHSKREKTKKINTPPGVSCGRPSMEPGVTLLSSTFVYGSKVPFTCPSGEAMLPTPLFVLQATIPSTLHSTAMPRVSGQEAQLDALPFTEHIIHPLFPH